MVTGIDPASLIAGRADLRRTRLEVQRQLIQQGTQRHTPVTVSVDGVIYDGNHGVRAAAEENVAVDVLITDMKAIGFGSILALPVT
jgi:hypothetical protein